MDLKILILSPFVRAINGRDKRRRLGIRFWWFYCGMIDLQDNRSCWGGVLSSERTVWQTVASLLSFTLSLTRRGRPMKRMKIVAALHRSPKAVICQWRGFFSGGDIEVGRRGACASFFRG